METIIGGELYTITLGWLGSKNQYLLSACTQMSNIGDDRFDFTVPSPYAMPLRYEFASRLTYKVYEVSITSAVLHYLANVIGGGSNHGAPLSSTPQSQRSSRGAPVAEDVSLPFADSFKICQVLIALLRVEQVSASSY